MKKRKPQGSEWVITTRRVRIWGLLGLVGILSFLLSVLALHFTGRSIDMEGRYLSELANRPMGWVFQAGTFVHGLGNLALTLGLRASLPPSRLRQWSVCLFGLAAGGILLAGIFPMDPPGTVLTFSGAFHRASASGAFAVEIAALFLFSEVFGYSDPWRKHKGVSLWISGFAAASVLTFIISIQLALMPGLTERIALIAFLCWEVWAAMLLIRFPEETGKRSSGGSRELPRAERN